MSIAYISSILPIPKYQWLDDECDLQSRFIFIFFIYFSAPVTTCDENTFMCSNKVCIPKQFLCDHDDDCGDGSDESPECGK